MTLSELSIRRPVFATVLCLLLVFVGLLCLSRLGVREMPRTERPSVTVQTTYRGASAPVVESRITQPIEDAVAGIEGIEKLASSSADETSRITIQFALDRDMDEAANDVRDRLSRLVSTLPQEADTPQILKSDGGESQVAFINLRSDRLSPMELTDYAERNIIDRYAALPGVARAGLAGARRPAMRIWPDRQATAARNLTVADITAALRAQNVELPAGRLESTDREFTLRTDTRLTNEEQFRQLIVQRGGDGYLVRLGEIAEVKLAPENERSASRSDGAPGVNFTIQQQSTANALEVAEAVEAETAAITATLPDHIQLSILINNGTFIRASLDEVELAVFFSLGCVLIVIYAFIGSWRATLIPALTIPVSIIASAIFIYAMGYSLNTLTLLAIVLAIGLVVDDAIVVLENIHRHMEAGESGLMAALHGSREIGFAVIATTVVLITVFVPLSFLTGAVGRLFVEFGLTLAASIFISCIVALSLVPMLSSKMFRNGIARGRVAHAIDVAFVRISKRYESILHRLLPRGGWIIAASVLALAGTAWLFTQLRSEGAPVQDSGFIVTSIVGPEGASFEYMDRVTRQIETAIQTMPGAEDYRRAYSTVPSGAGMGSSAMNRASVNVSLVDFDERTRSGSEVASAIQNHLVNFPEVQITARGSGMGSFGANTQQATFVLQGPDYATLAEWREILQPELAKNPGFSRVDVDYQERKPQMLVKIDRDRVAELGVSIQTLGQTLETMLGSRIVTTFVQAGREYNVVLQGLKTERATPADLNNIYVRSERTGELIPIANLARLEETAGAQELKRFNRLRAMTLTVRLKDGYSQGEAVGFMRNLISDRLPDGAALEFDGATREYLDSSSELYWTFAWALLVVFLVLAAQFESYVNALVIMATVPLAIVGAVLGMYITGVTINIYSQIAIVMLIGLAAKNGVLIVEFANQLRDAGREFREAIVEASATRLRPVLMTSFCAAGGAIPLYFAHGAGAENRHPVGVVVIYGVVVSMVLTLFVVPVVYSMLARNARTPQVVSRMIDKLTAQAATGKPVVSSP
ncbi:efflux RND transporter permease subunit [Povalibacter sp.]|uniref:efflux RND transporter permease subunit n=1 Tax=Povalibacter sp. TaxID=1962978 RepID=UPI002F426120